MSPIATAIDVRDAASPIGIFMRPDPKSSRLTRFKPTSFSVVFVLLAACASSPTLGRDDDDLLRADRKDDWLIGDGYGGDVYGGGGYGGDGYGGGGYGGDPIDAGTGPTIDAGGGDPMIDAGTGPAIDAGDDDPMIDAGTGPTIDAGDDDPDIDAGDDDPDIDAGDDDPDIDAGDDDPDIDAGDDDPDLDAGVDPIDAGEPDAALDGGPPPECIAHCTFATAPLFLETQDGCAITYTGGGSPQPLGNYGLSCPTDPCQQEELCEWARGSYGAEGHVWTQAYDGDELPDSAFPSWFGYPNPQDDGYDYGGSPAYVGAVQLDAHPDPSNPSATYWHAGDLRPYPWAIFHQIGARMGSAIDTARANEFDNPRAQTNVTRNLVVLGSSMMSTHNQTKNGRMCSRASTASDRRGLIGNDFVASPGWNTRVPWKKALALGRTGFASGDVVGAAGGTLDACKNAWPGPVPPAATGLAWLQAVGTTHGLLLTEGGLINDQQSTTGGWSDTLGALVACSALDDVTGPLNIVVATEHAGLNLNPFANPAPPTVSFVQVAPPGTARWSDVLDLPPGVPKGGCRLRAVRGQGNNPNGTIALINRLGMDIPPLIRLWNGVPANHPVRLNLAALAAMYLNGNVKQIWLQYPYMDRAKVVLRAADLALVLGAVPVLVANAVGVGNLTINAIPPLMRRRIRQVTDDLNGLMWDSVGCSAAPGGVAFAPAHAARVCTRVAGQPMLAITQDAFAGWAAADHQTTVVGGMPHESALGANKMGAAAVAADALP
jgi:hypothetical protein